MPTGDITIPLTRPIKLGLAHAEHNRDQKSHTKCDLLSVVYMEHRCRLPKFRVQNATAVFFVLQTPMLLKGSKC